MLSGDALSTAKAVALQSGILTVHEAKQKQTVMHAEEFRRLAGEVKWDIDEEGNEFQTLENPQKFQSVVKNLRVLARATPEDKYNIIFGPQQLGQKVCMTGDGPNDADALR